MPYKADVTLSSKGQLTLPAALRKLWALKAGDRLSVQFGPDGRATMTKRVRRSILDSRKDLAPLRPQRPVTQKDIDRAVGDAMTAQDLRTRGRKAR